MRWGRQLSNTVPLSDAPAVPPRASRFCQNGRQCASFARFVVDRQFVEALREQGAHYHPHFIFCRIALRARLGIEALGSRSSR
jgi:hypothetical protein